MHRSILVCTAGIGFLLLILFGVAPLFLPKSEPSSLPAEQFSAERAIRHVERLAQRPRLVGTAGMEEASSYVSAILQGCGLIPEFQVDSSPKGILRNVIARLPGRHPSGALLILTHVDSISYGAGDNASGAGVLLEAACALKAGKQLQNDIILLFEDGEEFGYLGGYAFALNDAPANPIRRVIGLDTAAWGPVVLLQTTPENASLVQAYASSVKNPTAYGFFADADWNISGDTSEIQPFFERGIPGLELEDPRAFSGKHSETDTLNSVLPGSLQQMGDQVLALARFLGDSDLASRSNGRLSFFSLWRIGLVYYPAGWNLALAALSFIAVAFLIGKGLRRKDLAGHALILAAIILFLALILAALAGAVGGAVFGALFPNPNPRAGSYLVPASLPFFAAATACIGIALLFLRSKLIRAFGDQAVRLGGLLSWAFFALISAVWLPVGSYLFTLPFAAGVLVSFFPPRWQYARLLPFAVGTILLAPNLALAFISTGLQTLPLVTLLVAADSILWPS